MSVVRTLLGNIKGPQGETGAQGAQGAQGEAATVNVGAVTTTAYGNPAQVINSGTESEAVLDFVIPQGKPGEATTKMGDLSLDAITTSTASFPSPQVGDTGKTAFGKIVKFFADTVAALNAKLNTANVVNNLTTTEAGYALDARAGKTLNDSLAIKQGNFTAQSGFSASSGDIVLKQSGNVVHISGYFHADNLSANISAVNAIAFSGVSAPSKVLRTVCVIADRAYHVNSLGVLNVNTINMLTVVSSVSVTDCYVIFNATYIV